MGNEASEYRVARVRESTATYEATGGRPRVTSRYQGTSGYLYHYHNGLKLQCKRVYERKNSSVYPIGYRCKLCGFLPDARAQKESQDALEAMLLRGFQKPGSRGR